MAGVTPLLIVLIVVAIVLLVLVALYLRLRNRVQREQSVSGHQLRNLRRHTLEWSVDYSELTFGKPLGKGSQGEVFRAKWRGSNVAVKTIDTRKVPPEIIEEFCQEAEIMRRLRHPQLTLFMGVCLEHPNLCIVTEIVNRGSLFDIIHDEHGGITWAKCLQIAVDVASGMTYLHAHSPPILHRDLKSLNILVDDNWRGKVADFGMTRFQEDGTMTQCGSPLWMAPEMIKNDPYDEKADVYSFGVCMWEMYTRKIPYRELNLNPSHLVVRVVRENLRPPVPSSCPKPWAELMTRCWHPVPDRRPSFPQVLKKLESFLLDPSITGHKPGSKRPQQTVVRADMKDVTPTAAAQVPQLGEGAWHIRNRTEVSIAPDAKPADPRFPLEPRERKHRVFSEGFEVLEGKYRGKEVAVKRCPVNAQTLAPIVEAPHKINTIPANTTEGRLCGLLKLVAHLRHPNIVLFMGAYIDQEHVGMVFENMSQGTLEGVIHDLDLVLEWDTMVQLLIDAASGMTYLHGVAPAPVIHQDLRTSRFWVDKSWRVKVADYVFVGLDATLRGAPLPPSPWMAPEVLVAGGRPSAVTIESNVYSFGLIMWEVLTRKRPFGDGAFDPIEMGSKIVDKGLRPVMPSSMTPELRDLITRCWAKDPKARPTFGQILTILQEVKTRGPPKLQLILGENAHLYHKSRTIYAYQSKDSITILKDWGKNVGKPGSFIVASGDDDVYLCAPDVFNATYERVGDPDAHEYRKIGTVTARLMEEPFSLRTGSGIEHGFAGDYVVQNAKGDQWVIEGKTFLGLYQRFCTDEQEREARDKEIREAKEAAAILAAAQNAQQAAGGAAGGGGGGTGGQRPITGEKAAKPRGGSNGTIAPQPVLPAPTQLPASRVAPTSIVPHGDSKERAVLNERKTFVDVRK